MGSSALRVGLSMVQRLLCALVLCLTFVHAEVHAQSLGVPTVTPPKSALVPWRAPPSTEPSAEDIARDPSALAGFLDRHPERLTAEGMTPELLISMARLLLEGERVFQAERLLHDGAKRFPDDVEVGRAWVRVAMSLERTEAVLEVLDRMAATHADDASLHYLRGVALIRRQPRRPEDTRAAATAWERVLALSPDFRDADGTTAVQLRSALDRMSADLSGKAAP